jgi:tetratricopeptide (TPR) repeat protein
MSQKRHSGLLPILLSVFISQAVLGATNTLLEAGINSFQQGKYDEAKQTFTNLMTDPAWKFAALYNLGNVAVRQNHFGEALGYYLRAAHQNPHDKDTQENIKFVITALGGRRLVSAPTNYDIYRKEVLSRFTFAEALAGSLLFSIFFLSSLKGFLKKRKLESEALPSTGAISSTIFLVLFTALSITKLIDTYSERGVIIVDHVDLRSGPSETNASMMEVTEGSEMVINDTDHDWVQVIPAGGGLMGWIPRTTLMITSGGGPF